MPDELPIFLEGRTPDGTHVRVTGDPPYSDFTVLINGEAAEVTGRAAIYRDGGTVRIPTARGEVLAFRKLGREAYNAFNGERLLSDDRTPVWRCSVCGAVESRVGDRAVCEGVRQYGTAHDLTVMEADTLVDEGQLDAMKATLKRLYDATKAIVCEGKTIVEFDEILLEAERRLSG